MTSIHDQIKEVVTTHRVVLFMKGTKQFPQCGFSSRAVQILNAAGCTDYVTVNVLENDAVRQGIKEYSDWPTIPQLYVNGEFVGGSDILMEIVQKTRMRTVPQIFIGDTFLGGYTDVAALHAEGKLLPMLEAK